MKVESFDMAEVIQEITAPNNSPTADDVDAKPVKPVPAKKPTIIRPISNGKNNISVNYHV